MPDPQGRYEERDSDPHGVGPFQFEAGNDFGNGDLTAGDRATLDLREYVENGTAGYYVVLSRAGYDALEVTNTDTDNPIEVKINENWVTNIPAGTVQSFGQSGMYRFTVTNVGATAIAAGDVTLEVQKEPYGADDAARERATENPLRGVLRKFTGL